MKKLLSILMLLTAQAHADWMLNPYTQRQDYYQPQNIIYVSSAAVDAHLAALDLSTAAIISSTGVISLALTAETTTRIAADSAIGISTGALRTDLAAVILSTQALSSATHLNTASTLVKRDASGNFSAGTITSNSVVSSTSSFSGTVTANYLSGAGANSVGDFKWKISVSSSCGTGWLRADGSSKSTTTYSALFAELGYSFGGTGANFSLPDMNNGEFVRAVSTATAGGGLTSGIGTKQLDAFQGHYHDFYTLPGYTTSGGTDIDKISASATTINSGGRVQAPITDGTNGTPRTAAETRPRNYAMIPCIFSGVK